MGGGPAEPHPGVRATKVSLLPSSAVLPLTVGSVRGDEDPHPSPWWYRVLSLLNTGSYNHACLIFSNSQSCSCWGVVIGCDGAVVFVGISCSIPLVPPGCVTACPYGPGTRTSSPSARSALAFCIPISTSWSSRCEEIAYYSCGRKKNKDKQYTVATLSAGVVRKEHKLGVQLARCHTNIQLMHSAFHSPRHDRHAVKRRPSAAVVGQRTETNKVRQTKWVYSCLLVW